MKLIHLFSYRILLSGMFIFFLQCGSAQKSIKISQTISLQKEKNPNGYYQHWISGVQEGGSGINLMISKIVMPNIIPITVFFRNQEAVIEVKKFDYVARYTTHSNQQKEYNKAMVGEKDFPFDLENDEAVLSYLDKGKKKYLKLTNIPEKEMLAYPSAPPN